MTATIQILMPAAAFSEGDRQMCFAAAPNPSKSVTNILPFGSTLHYPGCGCTAWQKGSRVADQVDALVARSHQLFERKLISPNRPLRVCYMLPHHNITGGMKCLVEHIRLLRQRGHYTIAVHRSDTASRAMPPWTTVEADADVVCNLHQRISDVYPVQDIDVVVVGIFHQVAELLAGVHAPVLYWEQGHEWVFGDPIRLQVAQNYLKQDQLFHLVMHLPCVLASVSSAVQDILQQEFGRSSLLIPNGIDCDRFTPGPWEPAAAQAAGEDTKTAAEQKGQAAADVVPTAVNPEHGLDGFAEGSGEAAGTAVARTAAGDAATALAAVAECADYKSLQQMQDVVATAAVNVDNDVAAEDSVLDLDVAGSEQQQLQAGLAQPGVSSFEHSFDSVSPRQPQVCQAPAGDEQQLFTPVAADAAGTLQAQTCSKKRILIVGNPALPLKGFPTAIAALAAVAAMIPIQVRWVCQVLPTVATVPNLPLVDFELETVVSPSQALLPSLYRGHDVFLFTSRYEAWGMPVLEAMASGVPVVTTDCLGVRTFCKHGENSLVAAPDDATGVAEHLLTVLTDTALQQKLAKAGRETALQYTPDKVMEHLEAILYSLTACGPELLQLRQSCLLDLQIACVKASEACSRPSNAAQQQQQQLALLQAQLSLKQQQLQQQAAAVEQRASQQQRLQVLLQQQQQQQQQQPLRLQSLQVLQQMNLVPPKQQFPLQASLLMPFLQVQQPNNQLTLQPASMQPSLQLQVRGFGTQQQQQQDHNAAVISEVLKLTSQQQQQQQGEQHKFVGLPLLQHMHTSQQLQQPNAAALHVLQQLQGSQQQQQQAATLSVLQSGSSNSGQLPPNTLFQQHLPTSILQQHSQSRQLQIPVLGSRHTAGSSAAANSLSLQLMSQQLQSQVLPLGFSPGQHQGQVQSLRQQQQQQYSSQLAFSQQLPLGLSQQMQPGFGQQQQQQQVTLGVSQQHPTLFGLSQQLGSVQQQQMAPQQQNDFQLLPQLGR